MCILISKQFYAILLAIQYKKIDASTNSEKEDKFLNQNSNLRTSKRRRGLTEKRLKPDIIRENEYNQGNWIYKFYCIYFAVLT
ncbi:hypothetical protein ASJ81_18015 [Methanosarcina spelaei]|uniref:Uncharacterized protein n=1 Tax=Methanosarcina spelaei TaxID=1036679 RepID=A0A2A2HVN0_9EURY|nr:hypothetical protein ASJ81_18015 [Methanosarcina spelaei]